MSFLGFLFLWFFIWLLYRLARIFFALYKAKRQARDFFADMFGNPNGAQGQSSKRKKKDKTPKTPVTPKKIDPTVGEYIKFEEIEVTATEQTKTYSDGTTRSSFKVEEQIVDVEWEDIP